MWYPETINPIDLSWLIISFPSVFDKEHQKMALTWRIGPSWPPVFGPPTCRVCLVSTLGGKPGRPVPSPIRRPPRDCKGAAFARKSCAKLDAEGTMGDVAIYNWDFMGFRSFLDGDIYILYILYIYNFCIPTSKKWEMPPEEGMENEWYKHQFHGTWFVFWVYWVVG